MRENTAELRKLFEQHAKTLQIMNQERITLGNELIDEHVPFGQLPLHEQVEHAKWRVKQLVQKFESDRPEHQRGDALKQTLENYSAILATLEGLKVKHQPRRS